MTARRVLVAANLLAGLACAAALLRWSIAAGALAAIAWMAAVAVIARLVTQLETRP